MKKIKYSCLGLTLLLPFLVVSCNNIPQVKKDDTEDKKQSLVKENILNKNSQSESTKISSNHTNTQNTTENHTNTQKTTENHTKFEQNNEQNKIQTNPAQNENNNNKEELKKQTTSQDTTKIIESLKDKVAETLWVTGVNLDLSKFRKQNDKELEVYEYPLKNAQNEGWYDINKRLNNGDWSLCSAVVATNWLHWWIDRNKEYIEKYAKKYPEKAIIKTNDIQIKFSTIRKNYPDQDNYYDRSEIFDYFTELFPNKALWPDKLVDMFINGYKYSNKMTLNTDDEYSYSPTRGFFRDVFKNNRLTDMEYPGNHEHFSETIKNWINEGRILAISYGSGAKGHIVTVWGADFDINGNIMAVYISDSDNKSDTMKLNKIDERQRVGMTRLRIDYTTGNAKLSGYIKEGMGVNIWNIYSLKNGQKDWQTFFKNE